MKIATSVWMGVALLAMAQAAAAAPLVSGKYALMSFTQCEAKFTTTTNGSAITSVNPSNSGELNIGVGIITFPATAASSGNASLALTNVSGGSLRINTTGEAMATHTEAVSGTYSITNTAFTFTPTGEPPMIWTMRPGNGVRTLYMVRRENARCVNAVTATKQ